MKIQSEELEKWVRMNKTAFWNICPNGKNKPLFTYNEPEATIENAIKSMYEAIECLPSGEYDFNGRSSQNGTRGTVSVTFSVGSYNSNSQPQNYTPANVMSNEQMIQDRVNQAAALIHKEYEVKEHLRIQQETKAMFEKLYKAMQQFEVAVWERFDELDGVKDGEMKTIFKDGLANVVNHGSKAVVDKFAGFS